MDKIRL